MNIKIIAVGKLKEKYTKDAIDEFKKRLGAYCSLSLVEIPAQEIKDENLNEKYKETEGQKILAAIKPDSYVITLEILGKSLSSEEFAQKIKTLSQEGHNEVVFVIGGANRLTLFAARLVPERLRLRFIARKWSATRKDAF